MKKALLVLAVLLGLASQGRAFDFSAVSPSGHTLYYTILDSAAHTVYACAPNDTARFYVNMWLGYTAPTGAVTVPDTVAHNGQAYAVKVLWATFAGCTGITSVTVPNTVTRIGNGAFFGCTGLARVHLPAALQTLERVVFYGCTQLDSVVLPTPVYYIGEHAFNGCTGLTAIAMSDSLKYIDNSAFWGDTSLTAAVFPNGLLSIGKYAFSTCYNLANVSFGSGLRAIGYAAFHSCALQSVTLPAGVAVVDTIVFYNCTRLQSVTLTGATAIRASAFANCTGLTTVSLPPTLAVIGPQAFRNCRSLSSVAIPASVASIGTQAFEDCRSLTQATIPAATVVTGLWAFHRCTSLAMVNFEAANCATMGSETYPVFDSCISLATLNIGAGVDTIAAYAFKDCSVLRTIDSRASVAPVVDFSTFDGVNGNIPVSIPCRSRSSYTSRWFYFANFVEEASANFAADTENPNKGTVQVLTEPTCGLGTAVLRADAATGYRFDHWTGGVTDNPYTLTVTGDTTIVAYFASTAANEYTITATSDDPAKGSVSGGGTYGEGASITLTATAATGYHFANWQDGNTDNPRTITVTADASYTAHFESNAPAQYTITVASNNPLMGSVSGGGTYNAGSTATLTATASEGHVFVNWQDGNTDNPRTITVTANASYTANFEVDHSGIGSVDGAAGIAVRTEGLTLVVAANAGSRLTVSDVAGHTLYSGPANAGLRLPLPGAGIYFVRTDSSQPVKVIALQ